MSFTTFTTRRFSFSLTILFLLLSVIPALSAPTSSSPIILIQSGTDKAIEILRAKQEKGGPTLRERREEILQIVDQYFDFREMARRALGRPWKEQSPEQQREFVSLFKQLLFNTYVDRVETYTYTNEKVAYDGEKIEGDYAQVDTRITGYKNTDVEVDYRLQRINGEWKVYDVTVEGISLVNNYRQQFNSILASQSFNDLLRIMRDKVKQQTGI